MFPPPRLGQGEGKARSSHCDPWSTIVKSDKCRGDISCGFDSLQAKMAEEQFANTLFWEEHPIQTQIIVYKTDSKKTLASMECGYKTKQKRMSNTIQ